MSDIDRIEYTKWTKTCRLADNRRDNFHQIFLTRSVSFTMRNDIKEIHSARSVFCALSFQYFSQKINAFTTRRLFHD